MRRTFSLNPLPLPLPLQICDSHEEAIDAQLSLLHMLLDPKSQVLVLNLDDPHAQYVSGRPHQSVTGHRDSILYFISHV